MTLMGPEKLEIVSIIQENKELNWPNLLDQN
jgi:hypothetical protein